MVIRCGRAGAARLRGAIRRECANWSRRGCALGRACVDEGEKCRWCENSILPAHPELRAAYERATAQQRLALGAVVAGERKVRVRRRPVR